MKALVLILTGCISISAYAKIPEEKIEQQMTEIIKPLHAPEGWSDFMNEHKNLFGDVSEKNPNSYVEVGEIKKDVDGKSYNIHIGCRSIYINAPPKVVVDVVDHPKFFRSLYALDKPADSFPVEKDGSYKAHIFKLVPGVETQDYTLLYTGKWFDQSWIGQASLVEDEKKFALRDNIKLVEPSGKGSIYREVALFFPLRWWMGIVNGLVQNVTRSELKTINMTVKCAAEKVNESTPYAGLNDDIAKDCRNKAQSGK